jgi:hypothetical protein
LGSLDVKFPDTDVLVEEIQRIDRIIEEKRASADGTLVEELPLIG